MTLASCVAGLRDDGAQAARLHGGACGPRRRRAAVGEAD